MLKKRIISQRALKQDSKTQLTCTPNIPRDWRRIKGRRSGLSLCRLNQSANCKSKRYGEEDRQNSGYKERMVKCPFADLCCTFIVHLYCAEQCRISRKDKQCGYASEARNRHVGVFRASGCNADCCNNGRSNRFSGCCLWEAKSLISFVWPDTKVSF